MLHGSLFVWKKADILVTNLKILNSFPINIPDLETCCLFPITEKSLQHPSITSQYIHEWRVRRRRGWPTWGRILHPVFPILRDGCAGNASPDQEEHPDRACNRCRPSTKKQTYLSLRHMNPSSLSIYIIIFCKM